MSSPEAPSAGPSTPLNYSSGPSTPSSYSSGLSTPPNYSSRSSRNAECSNCKHLRGKIKFFQNVFLTAKGYKLPPSYYAIKKTFKRIGLGYESIHACVNDCFLFWGDANKDVHLCPVYNMSRWKDNNTPGKKVPKKSPVGRAWKNFDTKYPDFAKEPRNVRLGLAIDGFNPFGNLRKTAYVSHNRFIKKPHKWRRSLEFNGEKEDEDPPREFGQYQIQPQLARLPTRVKGKHPKHRQGKIRLEKKRLGIRSGLWLGENKNRKYSKPQAAYSFTPEDRKMFCQFNKGVKLPDGFGSNFKHKVTDNDTNITGLKSHDYHIMMQRLLPYGLQQYLPPDVAKPLINLCLFFKQICSQTLMVDDMLKAQSKVIDILCDLELIYLPDFFDIMIHLVIHLPLEAIDGGLIRPRWMYPFERFMKKLKNYVRNKAKPKGSIAKGYVVEEALTFSSYYFRDVTTKFNHLERNVDCPPPTCQFQVFKSLCKLIGLRSVIRIDYQELKKVIWYVLHNSSEIDTYRAKFKRHERRISRLVWEADNDPGITESSELFALACGPSQNPISVNSCVVNGVRFLVHSHNERRTTQNIGMCSPGPDGEIYYGQLEQILEFSHLSFKTVLFRVKWSDTSNKGPRRPLGWKAVEYVSYKKFLNGRVIVVEYDPDVTHVDNSSDLSLSTSLNDLEILTLHIDGQSIDVDAPPDIIDVDEDDDIIDKEDFIPHNLADSDKEDLVNLDTHDGVNVVYSNEEED
nr:hypothetical protein [Tanacetum cinerariifolium]